MSTKPNILSKKKKKKKYKEPAGRPVWHFHSKYGSGLVPPGVAEEMSTKSLVFTLDHVDQIKAGAQLTAADAVKAGVVVVQPLRKYLGTGTPPRKRTSRESGTALTTLVVLTGVGRAKPIAAGSRRARVVEALRAGPKDGMVLGPLAAATEEEIQGIKSVLGKLVQMGWVTLSSAQRTLPIDQPTE